MDVIVLQKTAEALPDFPYPVEGNFKLEDFKQYYDFHMYEPSVVLAPYVAYYSIFEPKIPRGQELHFTQVLQVPAASLMFNRKKSMLFGVTTKKINHRAVTGDTKIRVIFKTAGLRAFCPEADMATLVDTAAPIKDYLRHFNENFVAELLGEEKDSKIVKKLETFLLSQRPVFDENIILINDIIKNLDENEDIMTINQVASKYHKSERWLQALFRSYVGVGLKWVIVRSRLVKVLQNVDSSEDVPWAQLAADLGYSTQSHLINDFKKLIGRTPSEFITIRNQP
jgi:AraC-like DNA-binding protein